MKWRHVILFVAGAGYACWGFIHRPFPVLGEDPTLDLVAAYSPRFYHWIQVWYYATPGLAVLMGGLVLLAVWRIWFASRTRGAARPGRLPDWPLRPTDEGPGIVIGEVHHPVEAREIFKPSWLTIPERGLYTGVAIFGAVGSGKTSACMHPFAQQILSWQAKDSRRRAAALVLEVKGDFCHDIRRILAEAGREEDYIELGMNGVWQWNPLSAGWLDSYSLAYTVSSLLNQLFGKGKEPFWQQAYTNLVRWIIELYRVFPGQWVTLRDVYRCAIDTELFAAKIEQAEALAAEVCKGTLTITEDDLLEHSTALEQWAWQSCGRDRMSSPNNAPLREKLIKLKVKFETKWAAGRGNDTALRVEAVNRWYQHDWQTLDRKVKSSIVEGVSVFLSMFDLPDVARVFCPPRPVKKAKTREPESTVPVKKPERIPPPELSRAGMRGHLPPLGELIDAGKVLALNMPAGINPALSRAIGVMLKNAWLQSLLLRPAEMKRSPSRYYRPAVFLCDEYQAFASVGEDDPSGDEKSFALTRQCRCIPIVATQSISSLRSVLGSSEAWRALLQTLRTRIFLSLSDDASARIASELCGQVAKIKPSYTINETSRQTEVSLLSARAGGGRSSVGTSKSFKEQRESVFHPRDFALLSNCQAICLPYDGAQSLEPCRVYLKPHYLPRGRSYWRSREAGDI